MALAGKLLTATSNHWGVQGEVLMKFVPFIRTYILGSKSKPLAYAGQKARALYLWLVATPPVWYIRYKGYLGDQEYIRQTYQKRFGYPLNLDDPKTFNEKNNWRKLYDRKEIYTKIVDKYQFKEYVAERMGEGYTFPLIDVWDRPEEIDFSKLPEKFVLKANHAGGVIVCRGKKTFDIKKAVSELKQGLTTNYFLGSREWPYKHVPRKIIAEQYMGENLTDFKNYCFNGKLQYTFVWENQSREDGRKPRPYFCGAYDRNWERSEIEINYPSRETLVEKPACYDEMVRVAESLSKDIPFVRVDCYIINNRVYAGEMTFFPWGGFMRFKDQKWDRMLGDLEILPEQKTEAD